MRDDDKTQSSAVWYTRNWYTQSPYELGRPPVSRQHAHADGLSSPERHSATCQALFLSASGRHACSWRTGTARCRLPPSYHVKTSVLFALISSRHDLHYTGSSPQTALIVAARPLKRPVAATVAALTPFPRRAYAIDGRRMVRSGGLYAPMHPWCFPLRPSERGSSSFLIWLRRPGRYSE
jgi:hypothetical protein